jgi:peroxiredoxin
VSSSLLAVGSRAPDFTASASDGRPYALGEILRAGPVVLIFYPGNNTPG